jgi:ABC-2 type transport system permease protein
MNRLAAALVIARRDYVATVWSRTFLLFLIGPLLPILFGGLFGALATNDERVSGPPPLSLMMDVAAEHRVQDARERLDRRLGADWLPPLVDGHHPGSAVLAGSLDRPVLSGAAADLRHLAGPVRLLLEAARIGPPAEVALTLRPVAAPVEPPDRRGLARGAQVAMFVVTVVLAGMLISNLVEEKSSKVIELLAAAVPVDAIFFGKLIGMLAVSVTGLIVWGASGFLAGAVALPAGTVAAPAIGWAAFLPLALIYWMMLYLLLGALYLGIGAQAGSVREVQTLSLPLTLGQLLFFGLASAAVVNPDRPIALLAAIVPWSSPFAMVARAAERPEWVPHLLALAWQAVALVLVVRMAARLFRRTVLRSGPGLSKKRGFRLHSIRKESGRD